jgi:hypothetical protein
MEVIEVAAGVYGVRELISRWHRVKAVMGGIGSSSPAMLPGQEQTGNRIKSNYRLKLFALVPG